MIEESILYLSSLYSFFSIRRYISTFKDYERIFEVLSYYTVWVLNFCTRLVISKVTCLFAGRRRRILHYTTVEYQLLIWNTKSYYLLIKVYMKESTDFLFYDSW